MTVKNLTNEQNIEAIHKSIKISTKPSDPWKRKMVDKISQLLLVMKEGEVVENNHKGKKNRPNWEKVYNFYVGGEAFADRNNIKKLDA